MVTLHSDDYLSFLLYHLHIFLILFLATLSFRDNGASTDSSLGFELLDGRLIHLNGVPRQVFERGLRVRLLDAQGELPNELVKVIGVARISAHFVRLVSHGVVLPEPDFYHWHCRVLFLSRIQKNYCAC